jgi:hypothetical protein
METLTPYIFKREAGRYVFLPSASFSAGSVVMFAAGSLLMIYLSTIFFRHLSGASANLGFGVIFLGVASFSAILALRAWTLRKTPLSIEDSGRVSYGERELCASGTVRAVRIVPSRDGGWGDYEIALELADRRLVYLPLQYFGVFRPREHARPFAAKLAEVLNVVVSESR